MSNLKKITQVTIACCAPILFGNAFAQEAETAAAEAAPTEVAAPVILVIDQSNVIYNSDAGKSMSEQLTKLQETANKEMEVIIKRIEQEAKDLQAQKDTLDAEEYSKQERQIVSRGQNINALRELKLRELGMSEKNATEVIAADLRDVLGVIVKERGATVLLDRANVMFAADTTDVTAEALAAINEKRSTVKVERVSLLKQK